MIGSPVQTWETGAACASKPGLPWTTDTHLVPDVVVDQMREVCASCPVRSWCEAQATYTDITGGFWAGRDRDRYPVEDTWERVDWLPVAGAGGRVVAEEQAALPLDLFGSLGGAA